MGNQTSAEPIKSEETAKSAANDETVRNEESAKSAANDETVRDDEPNLLRRTTDNWNRYLQIRKQDPEAVRVANQFFDKTPKTIFARPLIRTDNDLPKSFADAMLRYGLDFFTMVFIEFLISEYEEKKSDTNITFEQNLERRSAHLYILNLVFAIAKTNAQIQEVRIRREIMNFHTDKCIICDNTHKECSEFLIKASNQLNEILRNMCGEDIVPHLTNPYNHYQLEVVLALLMAVREAENDSDAELVYVSLLYTAIHTMSRCRTMMDAISK